VSRLIWSCPYQKSVVRPQNRLGSDLHVDDNQITTAITLTLLLRQVAFAIVEYRRVLSSFLVRSVGAALFGLAGDRWGRKSVLNNDFTSRYYYADTLTRRYPLIIVLLVISGLQIGTGFIHNLREFLAVRCVTMLDRWVDLVVNLPHDAGRSSAWQWGECGD
jgi:MFS family permease